MRLLTRGYGPDVETGQEGNQIHGRAQRKCTMMTFEQNEHENQSPCNSRRSNKTGLNSEIRPGAVKLGGKLVQSNSEVLGLLAPGSGLIDSPLERQLHPS